MVQCELWTIGVVCMIWDLFSNPFLFFHPRSGFKKEPDKMHLGASEWLQHEVKVRQKPLISPVPFLQNLYFPRYTKEKALSAMAALL